jgi:hypothetical protein
MTGFGMWLVGADLSDLGHFGLLAVFWHNLLKFEYEADVLGYPHASRRLP